MQVGRDQSAGAVRFFHQTEADDEQALNQAIPGATFDWIADSGSSFTARFRHMLLDGLVLTHLGLDQASYVTLGERIPDFNIWHAIDPRGAVNGGAVRQEDLVLARPGEGATLHTGAPDAPMSPASSSSVATGWRVEVVNSVMWRTSTP